MCWKGVKLYSQLDSPQQCSKDKQRRRQPGWNLEESTCCFAYALSSQERSHKADSSPSPENIATCVWYFHSGKPIGDQCLLGGSPIGILCPPNTRIPDFQMESRCFTITPTYAHLGTNSLGMMGHPNFKGNVFYQFKDLFTSLVPRHQPGANFASRPF